MPDATESGPPATTWISKYCYQETFSQLNAQQKSYPENVLYGRYEHSNNTTHKLLAHPEIYEMRRVLLGYTNLDTCMILRASELAGGPTPSELTFVEDSGATHLPQPDIRET